MKLTNMQKQWQFVAKYLGLSIETPFKLTLPNGEQMEVEVLVRGYGAPQGTIVASNYDSVAHAREEIIALGYTISSYAQPPEHEIESIDGFEEMLNDWGAC